MSTKPQSAARVLALAALLAGASTQPSSAHTATFVLDDTYRTSGSPCAVWIASPSDRIETEIHLNHLHAPNSGGGLIGGLIVAAGDDRAKQLASSLSARSDALASPLRADLHGLDLGAMALATTRTGLARVPWFTAGPVAQSQDDDAARRTAFLKASATARAAMLVWRYAFSPDFSRITVTVDLSLTDNGAAPVTRFHQRLSSIAQLRNRSLEPAENAATWATGNGTLARAGLTLAFARLEQLIPRALTMTPAELAAITARDHPKVFAADAYGPLMARAADNPGEVLLWSDGLVNIAPVPAPTAPSAP